MGASANRSSARCAVWDTSEPVDEMTSAPRTIAFYDAYASLDGSGRILRIITSNLDRARFEPLVILPRDEALAEALREDGCHVVVLPPDPPLDSYGGAIMASGVLGKARAAASVRRHAADVARCLREEGAALLHCNQTRAVLQAGMGGVRAGIPVVWNVLIREPLPSWLVRYAGGLADHVIGLTPDIIDDFAGGDRLRTMITIIPNSVDAARFSPDLDGTAVRRELGLRAGHSLILMIGVLARRKGHDVLVRAAPRIIASLPSARIVIAGGVPDGGPSWQSELEALIVELKVDGIVRLLGWRSDVPELLAACDLYALPSRREGFPGTVLEAMASARPVVATPAAAAGVIDGVTGRIVPTDDHDALADAIIETLADPDRARGMGEEGRRVAMRDYSAAAIARRYEDVYTDLLGAPA